jgi:stress response protein YsnF
MRQKNEFLKCYPKFNIGMLVYSEEGEKLGRVSAMEEDCFVVEKGFFFPRDFTARYEDIDEVTDEKVILEHRAEELRPWKNESYVGWGEFEKRNAGSQFVAASDGEITVPVMAEEMQAHKTLKPSGEVRVRKVVHTELKNLTVPVGKEDVHIPQQSYASQRDVSDNIKREEVVVERDDSTKRKKAS